MYGGTDGSRTRMWTEAIDLESESCHTWSSWTSRMPGRAKISFLSFSIEIVSGTPVCTYDKKKIF
jgi:hypothetical protein